MFEVRVEVGDGFAAAEFDGDVVFEAQAANTLRFDVRVTGMTPDAVQAVVLRRRDTNGTLRVIHRMTGPNMMQAHGTIPLSGIDRDALVSKRLSVALFTAASSGESPVTGIALRQ